MSSSLGLWDAWYVGLRRDTPQYYGDTTTYGLAAEWLQDCATIADWGCGKGGFRSFVGPKQRYIGYDGSATPFADQIVDLAEFRSNTEGILLRHVVEHNYRWRAILRNAAASFTKRLVVVLFTPLIDSPEPVVNEIAHQQLRGQWVPDLSFSVAALSGAVGSQPAAMQTVASGTQYHQETLIVYVPLDPVTDQLPCKH